MFTQAALLDYQYQTGCQTSGPAAGHNAVIALRSRSLLPCILAHALTNAILLVLDRRGGDTLEMLATPTPWAIAGLAVVMAGLASLTAATLAFLDIPKPEFR